MEAVVNDDAEWEENDVLNLTLHCTSMNEMKILRNMLMDKMSNQFTGNRQVDANGIHSKRVGRKMLATAAVYVEFDDVEEEEEVSVHP